MWNITGYTGIADFMGSVNGYTGGWFWSLMLTALAVVMFVTVSLRTTTDRAFGLTGFGTWILGTFMFFLGWINGIIYTGTIFLLVAGVVAMIARQEREF